MSAALNRLRTKQAIQRVEGLLGYDISVLGADIDDVLSVLGAIANPMNRADAYSPPLTAVTVYWGTDDGGLTYQTFPSPQHVTVQGRITIGDPQQPNTYRLTEKGYQIAQNYLAAGEQAPPSVLKPFTVTVDDQKISRPVVIVDLHGCSDKNVKWSRDNYVASALSRTRSLARKPGLPATAKPAAGIVAAIRRLFR